MSLALTVIPHERFDRALAQVWDTLSQNRWLRVAVRYVPLPHSGCPAKRRELQLTLAAGMRSVNPATQYLMLNIDVEIPHDRSSLRGVGGRLTVEDISRRAELHPEETAESWHARFRMHRTGAATPLPEDRVVQIVIHVNMVERQADPLVFHTSRFMSAVAQTEIHDPYDPLTAGNMVLYGAEVARGRYWRQAEQLLDQIIVEYRPPVAP